MFRNLAIRALIQAALLTPPSDVDALERRIVALNAAPDRLRATLILRQDISTPELELHARSETRYALQRLDERRWRYASQAWTRGTTGRGKLAQKFDRRVHIVNDADAMLVLNESGRSAWAVRLKPDASRPVLVDAAWFESLRKRYTLSLADPQRRDNRLVWMLVALARQPAPHDTADSIRHIFDAAAGLLVATEVRDGQGRLVESMELQDWNLAPDIADEDFTFRTPPHAHLTDLTSAVDADGEGDGEPNLGVAPQPLAPSP